MHTRKAPCDSPSVGIPKPRVLPFVDLKTQYQQIKSEIDEAVQGVLNKQDFILGSSVKHFEEAFAAYCQTRYCVGVGNGLDALTLALKGLGVASGDEVIIPANTFIATAMAVLQTGATPVLVEYDASSYNIDPACIRRAMTEKTKAIVPVHLYGRPANMKAIGAIAQEFNLLVVEDAAQAHGALYRGRRCGSFGDAAAFSFYPGKNLGAYGDGGAVVTNNPELATWLKKARSYGSIKKNHHEIPGVNSRLDSVQAAVLGVKLPYLDRWNALRQSAAVAYHEQLKDLPIGLPMTDELSDHVFHLYVIQTDQRDAMRDTLSTEGIQTGVHYPTPIHRQAACKDSCLVPEPLGQTERAAHRLLSLPMHPHLLEEDVERVAGALRSMFVGSRRAHSLSDVFGRGADTNIRTSDYQFQTESRSIVDQ